jgi:uncharacterized protein (TIGR02145 family)
MHHPIKILNAIFILLLITLYACKKEESKLPEVTTNEVLFVRRTYVGLDGAVRLTVSDSIIAYGFCWNTKGLPTLNDNITERSFGLPQHFQAYPEGLRPNTTYYVRAYATNLNGTNFGLEKTFTTMAASATIVFNPNLTYHSVSDVEGNVYKTIEIGTQTWMAENLKATRYNDNTEIPYITDNNEWEHLKTPGYCWYENNEEIYKNIYGAYYNAYAVNTGKLCPTGWHVPSNSEWKTFELFLGMSPESIDGGIRGTIEGLKIKETGKHNWFDKENIDGTNESGFTGLPGGRRMGYDGGTIGGEGILAFWWTSSGLLESNYFVCRWLLYNKSIIIQEGRELSAGFNVRCIRD